MTTAPFEPVPQVAPGEDPGALPPDEGDPALEPGPTEEES